MAAAWIEQGNRRWRRWKIAQDSDQFAGTQRILGVVAGNWDPPQPQPGEGADATAVAEAIVKVVDAPFGKRPFRVHIDPTEEGADVGFTVLDGLRAEMLHRVGLCDLLKPRRPA